MSLRPYRVFITKVMNTRYFLPIFILPIFILPISHCLEQDFCSFFVTQCHIKWLIFDIFYVDQLGFVGVFGQRHFVTNPHAPRRAGACSRRFARYWPLFSAGVNPRPTICDIFVSSQTDITPR